MVRYLFSLKRMTDVDDMKNKDLFLEYLGKQWALSISQLFERVYHKIYPTVRKLKLSAQIHLT